jgi:hypothetical protein
MAFTVEDFQDLLRLLEQRPEWQAELRRRVLTDELLELPALVRQLIAAQARTEERLERLESTVAKLAEAQLRTEEALLALTGRFEEHERRNALDLQPLKEFALAQKLADRPGVFRPLLTEPEPLRPAEASAWFTTLADEGRLAPDEYQELLWADLLVRGRRDPGRLPRGGDVLDHRPEGRRPGRAARLAAAGTGGGARLAGGGGLPSCRAGRAPPGAAGGPQYRAA